jgi:hypothetical protein
MVILIVKEVMQCWKVIEYEPKVLEVNKNLVEDSEVEE